MRHLDVPNLRGRDVLNDHTSGRDVSKRREVPKDRNIELDDEFNFGSAEEAKGGSTVLVGQKRKDKWEGRIRYVGIK